MDRRSFLKGLMGVVGVAALGLPQIDASEVVAEVESFLAAGGDSARPVGDIGSVRIDDTWYALNHAELSVQTLNQAIEGDDRVMSVAHRVVGYYVDIGIEGNFVQVVDSRLYDVELRMTETPHSYRVYSFDCKARVRYATGSYIAFHIAAQDGFHLVEAA